MPHSQQTRTRPLYINENSGCSNITQYFRKFNLPDINAVNSNAHTEKPIIAHPKLGIRKSNIPVKYGLAKN